MTTNTKQFHYSWIIMIACGIMLFYSIGLAFNCFTVFLAPLKEALGLTGAQDSSIISIMNVGNVTGMLIAVPLYRKVGAREIAYGSAICMAAGAVIYAFAGSLLQCYIASTVSGFGYGAGSIIPASILISAWFEQKRGFAMGLASACTGLATIIFSPIFASIILKYSIRTGFLVEAALIFGLGTICFLLIRNKPEEKGLFPFGHDHDDSESMHIEETGILFKDALRGKTYYLMFLGVLFVAIVAQPVMAHLSIFCTSNGYSPMFAAYMVSVFGVTMMFFKPTYGFLIDKLGVLRASFITYGAVAGSCIAGLLVGHSAIAAVLLAVCIGMGIAPISTLALPMWITVVFGTKDMSTIFTSYKILYYCIGALGSTLPGLFFDHTGSYLGVFWVFIACGIVSFLFIRSVLNRKAY